MTFNEAQHPRKGAGTAGGGEFTNVVKTESAETLNAATDLSVLSIIDGNVTRQHVATQHALHEYAAACCAHIAYQARQRWPDASHVVVDDADHGITGVVRVTGVRRGEQFEELTLPEHHVFTEDDTDSLDGIGATYESDTGVWLVPIDDEPPEPTVGLESARVAFSIEHQREMELRLSAISEWARTFHPDADSVEIVNGGNGWAVEQIRAADGRAIPYEFSDVHRGDADMLIACFDDRIPDVMDRISRERGIYINGSGYVIPLDSFQ